ncbi:MAG TPA: pyridoxamine 5'-phosphate oxidase family protein [Blastocatellia bacterium]
MTPELKAALKRHTQLFGSYTKAGELKKIRVWLTLNQGKIEFLTSAESLKVKRIKRNPRVRCLVGEVEVPGTAEVVTDKDAILQTYRAYRKTHPFIMLFIAPGIRSRLKSGKQALIRVTPDEPNPFVGMTDPVLKR